VPVSDRALALMVGAALPVGAQAPDFTTYEAEAARLPFRLKHHSRRPDLLIWESAERFLATVPRS